MNQFGPFWAQVFTLVSLNTVHTARWFILILAFLMVSCSLCMRFGSWARRLKAGE